MAESKNYVRFVDRKRRIFGKSKYRPSEGWVDVVLYNIPGDTETSFVALANNDAVLPQLYGAFSEEKRIDQVVLEIRGGSMWFRTVWDDVLIVTIRAEKRPEFIVGCWIGFDYKKKTSSHGVAS